MINDALIIGGGPAGATVAWFLARAGWSVALVEKAVFPRRKVCGEFVSATTLPLLHTLGVGESYLELAGPPVLDVGLYARKYTLSAPMPVNPSTGPDRGRALGREHLDDLLLNNARSAGVNIIQPWQVTGLARSNGIFNCQVTSPGKTSTRELQAIVVIAAHGSWEHGDLPMQTPKQKPAPGDLFAFKAHFTQSDLPPGLMPLLAFPGGYGGMVHTDHGRVSLSCCIRHDRLRRLRAQGHQAAGEIVLAHIMEHCDGVSHALAHAGRESSWLSSGPIRPGIHTLHRDGIFAVGNCAGEAHPVVAEGISMAMQGAWLLSQILFARQSQVLGGNTEPAGHAYARAWRRLFASRVRHAALFANLAMRPGATGTLLPLFQRVPGLLTLCANLSGKIRRPGLIPLPHFFNNGARSH